MSHPEKEVIKDVINDVGRLTDMKQWERLEQLFIGSPVIDTKLLTGEQASQTDRKNFISDLKQEMSKYFAGTRHKMKTFAVEVQGRKAEAYAIINRSHFIVEGTGRYVWQVSAAYTFELVKRAGQWRIAKLHLKPLNQSLLPMAV